VHGPVQAVPPAADLIGERCEVLVAVDVKLEHVRGRVELRRRALGHPAHPAEARQQDLGALTLRALGDRIGDRVAVDDARDEDSLALEDHRNVSPP
jgi:hypothetical protein